MSQTYVPTALRKLVRERAQDRCEYCLIPESVTFAPHWIDRIVAEKHGGTTEADNLANSCVVCNQAKGSDLTSIDPPHWRDRSALQSETRPVDRPLSTRRRSPRSPLFGRPSDDTFTPA